MLIDIPCKIGDAVYGIRNRHGKKSIERGYVSEILFSNDMKLHFVIKYICRGQWGENIFATYEAAELKLKGE